MLSDFFCEQIKRATNYINSNKRGRKSFGMLLLDIECASDSMWHDALIYKLYVMNFPIYLCKCVIAFCSDRSFTVQNKNDTSTEPAVVPQDSALPPIIFTIHLRFQNTTCA